MAEVGGEGDLLEESLGEGICFQHLDLGELVRLRPADADHRDAGVILAHAGGRVERDHGYPVVLAGELGLADQLAHLLDGQAHRVADPRVK